MSLWYVLYKDIHQFRSSSDDEDKGVACAKAILALSMEEQKDLAYRIIRNSPHVVATAESWPYMLAIALIQGWTANVEKEAGHPTTKRRYPDTVHRCLTR
jgi:2-methylcitrate dehydratase PrpD